jgi:flagellar hook assembly protein FlgD
VDLVVYNLAGQQVRVLDRGQRQAGYYQAQWDGRDQNSRNAAAGMYFYRLVTGENTKTRKMLMIR